MNDHGLLGPQPTEREYDLYKAGNVLASYPQLAVVGGDDKSVLWTGQTFHASLEVADRFYKQHSTTTVLVDCTEQDHPKLCPHKFIDFCQHAHAFLVCDRCSKTPMGSAYLCENCVVDDIYVLCSECQTSEPHSCAGSCDTDAAEKTPPYVLKKPLDWPTTCKLLEAACSGKMRTFIAEKCDNKQD